MRIIRYKLPLRYVVVFSNFTIMFAGLFAALMVYYSTSYLLLKSFVYNSDALYLSSLYADVLNGDNLSKWNLSPSLYIFPDMFLYFLVRTITANIHTAIVVFGMIQYLVFAIGLMFLAKQAIPQSYGLARYTLIALMGVFFLLFINTLEFSSQMFAVSVYHFGIILCIPFVLTILCKLISGTHFRASHVCVLYILSFLISASDGLYLVQVTIPLIGSLGMLLLAKSIDMKRALVVSGTLLIANLTGLALISVNISRNEMVGAYLFRPDLIYLSFSRLFLSFATILYISPVHAVLALDFLLICVFILVKLLRQSLRDKRTVVRSADILLTSYFLLSLTVNVLAIISSGAFLDRSGLRYFLPFLVFSGFWGIPFVLRIPPVIKTELLEWVVLGVLTLTVFFALRSIEYRQVTNVFTDVYYPADIRCIDENTAKMGLKHGIAQYWQARPISLLTQNKLKIVQVGRDLTPYYWISNLAWYEMEPEFAVIDLSLPEDDPFRLDESLITNLFGEPDAMFQCGSSKIMVYRRPDSEFRNLFRNIP